MAYAPELDSRPTVVAPERIGTLYDAALVAAQLEQARVATRWQAPPSAY